MAAPSTALGFLALFLIPSGTAFGQSGEGVRVAAPAVLIGSSHPNVIQAPDEWRTPPCER
jgi:hypothetical protein